MNFGCGCHMMVLRIKMMATVPGFILLLKVYHKVSNSPLFSKTLITKQNYMGKGSNQFFEYCQILRKHGGEYLRKLIIFTTKTTNSPSNSPICSAINPAKPLIFRLLFHILIKKCKTKWTEYSHNSLQTLRKIFIFIGKRCITQSKAEKWRL
jgi:hypothetical protein